MLSWTRLDKKRIANSPPSAYAIVDIANNDLTRKPDTACLHEKRALLSIHELTSYQVYKAVYLFLN